MPSEIERLERDHGWRLADHASPDNGVWVVPALREALSYPADCNVLCAGVEERSFWFHHRNRMLAQLICTPARPAALWDVGAGNGFVARHLQGQGLEAVAVEPGPAGARAAAQRGVRHTICALFQDLHLPADSLPAIGCFDVLEHLEHPEALVLEFYRVLAPGGIAAVSLPALGALWSEADDLAGHRKRFSRRAMDALFESAGFVRRRSMYTMAVMVPLVYLCRALPYRLGKRYTEAEAKTKLLRELAPPNPLLTAIARALLWLEAQWSRLLPLPFGTSVLGLYVKPPLPHGRGSAFAGGAGGVA